MSNGSVYGQIIGLINTWNSVCSPTSETLIRHVNCGKDKLKHMICGRDPLAATVGLFNNMQQYINKHRLLPVLYTLTLSTCVNNMHVSPR